MDNRKNLIKQLSKIGLFLVIFFICLNVFSHILLPKNNNKKSGIKYENARGFYGERKNSLDIIALGNSNLYSSFIPNQLWNNKGYTSYVCAEPSQTVFQAYALLKEVFSCQKPQLVILETDGLFTKGDEFEQITSMYMKEIFPVFEYHSRWRNIQINDFTDSPHYDTTINNKGYVYRSAVKPYKGGKKYLKKKNKRDNFNLFNQMYLDKINQLCQENHASLLLLSVPSAKAWNYEKHNIIKEYALKKNIPFLDLNTEKKQANIDWMTDTKDKGMHLNINGARKVTKYLEEYLQKKYTFIDHRNDIRYDEWNRNKLETIESKT